MRSFTILSGLAAILPIALAGDAPEVTNQPPGVQYVATLPNTTTTTGSVMIGSGSGGDGVQVQVSFSGLPSEGGPFRKSCHNIIKS